jgi:aspartate/methionine/tyrosine aminotransferase
MSFVPFELERWQSTWEKRVRFNLAESGVHALSVAELLELTGSDPRALGDVRLSYNQSDGSEDLRRAIASTYPNVRPEEVTVTVGSAEANFIVCWTLIEPGDHIAVVTPTYMQIPGLVRNFGATVSEIPLQYERGWTLDLERMHHAIRPGTKAVIVTNPNNPTGAVLSDTERRAIVARTDDVGAWLLADEVYHGAELEGPPTGSFWNEGGRTIVVNGLSKAYGLPGLRVGWIVSSPAFKERVLRRHDYTVIGPSPASDLLAELALGGRDAVLARTRGILTENYPILDRWLRDFGDLFEWRGPACGAIALARYHHGIRSAELAERVRAACDVLLAPGAHFGTEHTIRFGFGNERAELEAALATLGPVLQRLLT